MYRSFAALLSFLLFSIIIFGARCAPVWAGDEFPICTDATDQSRPAVSGNIVVWEDFDGDWDIYGYNVTTGSKFPICTSAGSQRAPTISGNIVVWGDERNGGSDIYGYDLSTGTEFAICTNAYDQWLPVISGNIVAWVDCRNTSGNSANWDIYGYNLATHQEFPICTAEGGQYGPAISGDIVIWTDLRSDPTVQFCCGGNELPKAVYGYDLSENSEFFVTLDGGIFPYAAIDSNNVVWSDEGDFVCGYDLMTSMFYVIDTSTYNCNFRDTKILGDRVIWADNRNGNYDIYGFDMIDHVEFPICTDTHYQYLPAISGNLVVWQDDRNGNEDIYGRILTDYQLTINVNPAAAGAASGAGSYTPGATVEVLAGANPGWQFVSWSGAVADPNATSTTVAMDADKTVTANFALITNTLSTTVSPADGGSVSGAGSYDYGTTATAQAMPAADYWFTGWSGDLTGSTNPTTIAMDDNKSVTANFTHTPPAPTGLTANALSASQIGLSWSYAGTVTGFRIYRKTGSGDWGVTPIAAVSNAARSYTDNSLTAGTLYTYRICAYNSYADSPFSNEAAATTPVFVAAPSNLSAKAVSATQVNLSWADKSTNETGFNIERRLGTTGAWETVGTVSAGVKSYSDTTAAPNSTYNYRVSAFAGASSSAYSRVVSVMTPIHVAAPTNLLATPTSANAISLTWTDNADNETGYKIERRKSTVNTWKVVATTGANVTSFNNTGLTGGTTYVFRVRAYRSTVYSGYSNESSATATTP
jgi:uncharacterized repeat protein (TIGR02543 family)